MPEAYTHIRIARRARALLSATGADSLMDGPGLTVAYEMGAQGPDPLFAFHILSARKPYPMAQLGGRIHAAQCGRFLRALVFRAYSPVQRAYTLGFLTHYAADAALHPYVEAMAREGQPFGMQEGHGFCEVAMDSYFHEKDGLGAAVQGDDAAPALVTDALAEVCALLHACVLEVYGEDVPVEHLADAFHDFRWLHGSIFVSKHGGKRALVWLAERLVLRRPGYGLSHMTPAKQPPAGFPTDWADPATGARHEGEGPDALCEAAAADACALCKAAAAYWQGAADKAQLAVALGDRSFSTGQLSLPAEEQGGETGRGDGEAPPALPAREETPAAPQAPAGAPPDAQLV